MMKKNLLLSLLFTIALSVSYAQPTPAVEMESKCKSIDVEATCTICQARLDRIGELLKTANDYEKEDLLKEKVSIEDILFQLKEVEDAKGLKEYWQKLAGSAKEQFSVVQTKLGEVKKEVWICMAIGGVVFAACLVAGTIVIITTLKTKNDAVKAKNAAETSNREATEKLRQATEKLEDIIRLKEAAEKVAKEQREELGRKNSELDTQLRELQTRFSELSESKTETAEEHKEKLEKLARLEKIVEETKSTQVQKGTVFSQLKLLHTAISKVNPKKKCSESVVNEMLVTLVNLGKLLGFAFSEKKN